MRARHISGVVPSAAPLPPGSNGAGRVHGFFNVSPKRKQGFNSMTRWVGIINGITPKERAERLHSHLRDRVSLSTYLYSTPIEAAKAVDRCGSNPDR